MSLKRQFSLVAALWLAVYICLACGSCGSSNQAATQTNNSTAPAVLPKSTAKKPVAPASVTVNPNAPKIIIFNPTPAIVREGGTSVLKWEVSNATSVSISPTVGAVDLLGSTRVSPLTSTMYTMTAVNSQGTVMATATVMVERPYSTLFPVVFSFIANPRMVSENSSCALSWDIYRADGVTLAKGNGTSAVTISERLTTVGKMTVLPPYILTAAESKLLPTATTVPCTTVYSLSALNITGTTTLTTDVTVLTTALLPKPGIPMTQDNVTVLAANVLPMISWLASEPTTIIQGNSALLSWEVVHANKVLLNGVPVAHRGSQVISPMGSATYTLTASNDYWTIAKTCSVTVLPYNDQWFKPLVQ